MQKTVKKVAVLVSANLLDGHPDMRNDAFELEEEIGKLKPAFAANGMDLDLVVWQEAPACAHKYDAILPLLVWDYFENDQDVFLQAMAQIGKKTELFNRFKVLKWNANKAYLEEMTRLGAPTIPTVKLDHISEAQVLRAMQTLRADKVVIKPDVGGGAWRQALYEKGQNFPDRTELPPHGAMIQPFLKNVEEEGEYSFLYFGGRFSHALLKSPKTGDYRVQSSYGGTEQPYSPTNIERKQARSILDVLEFIPLYARVDLLRADDGRLLLIELEMVEPYLYLSFSDGEGGENKGAQMLAKALARKLDL